MNLICRKKQCITLQELLYWLVTAIIMTFIIFNGPYFDNFLKFILFLPLFLCSFYTQKFIIFPKFYLKEKYLLHIIITIILIFFEGIIHQKIILFTNKYQDFNNISVIVSKNKHNAQFVPFIIHLFVNAIALGFCYYENFIKLHQEVTVLLRKKIKLELEALNNQIHPHFLLNTLNNIYVLTQEKNVKTAESIIKLSELLRYMTYENNNNNTLLSKELDAVVNYIHLIQLQYEQILDIKIDNKTYTQNISIPSNIIFPLIENSFKHSNIGSEKPSYINLSINENDTNNTIEITIENSIAKNYRKSEFGGIGLKNVKQRLQLLYPEINTLITNEKENEFIAQIIIPKILSNN